MDLGDKVIPNLTRGALFLGFAAGLGVGLRDRSVGLFAQEGTSESLCSNTDSRDRNDSLASAVEALSVGESGKLRLPISSF